jgi:hypothetical protein
LGLKIRINIIIDFPNYAADLLTYYLRIFNTVLTLKNIYFNHIEIVI